MGRTFHLSVQDMWDVVVEALVWICAMGASALAIFMTLFRLVSLIDLESDFINPVELCQKVNKLVIPEYIVHGSLVVFFLLTGYWVEMILNLPLLGYRLFLMREQRHLLDPTRIFTQIDLEKKVGFVVLLYYVLFLFYY